MLILGFVIYHIYIYIFDAPFLFVTICEVPYKYIWDNLKFYS